MSENNQRADARDNKDSSDEPKASTKRKRRFLRPVLLIVGPLAVIIGAVVWYYSGGRYVGTENAYVHASMAAISPRVKGAIIDVRVAENQQVAKNAVLFTIDPRPYEIAVEQAEANIEAVRQDLQALKDTYAQQESSLQLDKINRQYAQRKFDRRKKLSKTNVVSQSALDEAHNALDAANQKVVVDSKQMQTTLARLGGKIDLQVEKMPSVRQARAALEQARLDLAHTTVKAPFSGIVTNKPELGTYVTPGTAVMGLVSNDDVWIEANFKEIDLTHVVAGQTVDITVDTFPAHVWHGTVSSLAPATGAELSVIPAQNATGNWVKVVQRIPVRISVNAKAGQPALRSGMSTEVEIDTHHKRQLPGFARTVLSWLNVADTPNEAHAEGVDTLTDARP